MFILPLLLSLSCAPAATPLTQSVRQEVDNVVIVLDASGSMKESMGGAGGVRMDAAKSAIKQVLKTVPDSTHVGLLVFGGKNVPDIWIYPLGPRDDAKLTAGLDRILPNGGTPLGHFMKLGADHLLEVRDKNNGYGSYRLLMVTDGAAGDQELLDAYLPDVLSRGITVDVIGVSMKNDHKLATSVNSYRRADDAEALREAISQVFAEVGGSGDGDVDEDVFEILQALPDEMTMGVISAITASDNDPIHKVGFSSAPSNKTSNKTSNRTVKNNSSGSRTTSSPYGSAPVPGSSVSTSFLALGGGCAFLMIATLVLTIVLIKRARGGSGRRRRGRMGS